MLLTVILAVGASASAPADVIVTAVPTILLVLMLAPLTLPLNVPVAATTALVIVALFPFKLPVAVTTPGVVRLAPFKLPVALPNPVIYTPVVAQTPMLAVPPMVIIALPPDPVNAMLDVPLVIELAATAATLVRYPPSPLKKVAEILPDALALPAVILPVTASEDNAPTLVILFCATVVNVPPTLVNAPVVPLTLPVVTLAETLTLPVTANPLA